MGRVMKPAKGARMWRREGSEGGNPRGNQQMRGEDRSDRLGWAEQVTADGGGSGVMGHVEVHDSVRCLPPSASEADLRTEWRSTPLSGASASRLVLPLRGDINTWGNMVLQFTCCSGDVMGHFITREEISHKKILVLCSLLIYFLLWTLSFINVLALHQNCNGKKTDGYIYYKRFKSAVIERCSGLRCEFGPMNLWLRRLICYHGNSHGSWVE